MTSMPASRSARAMIFAPRSCPSRPGLATTTRIFFVEVEAAIRASVGERSPAAARWAAAGRPDLRLAGDRLDARPAVLDRGALRRPAARLHLRLAERDLLLAARPCRRDVEVLEVRVDRRVDARRVAAVCGVAVAAHRQQPRVAELGDRPLRAAIRR